MIQYSDGPNLLTPNRFMTIQSTVSGLYFDSATLTLLAAMSTPPDATRQVAINTAIVDLKNAGIWTLLDEIWFFAAHNEQSALLGWKRYKNCTNVSMPFTVDRGFQGDGTAKYLTTGFNALSSGVNFTQNNHSWGVYSRTNTSEGNVDMGCINSSLCQLLARNATGFGTVQASITSGSLAPSVADSLGLSVARRTASNAQQMYKNGADVGSNGSSSATLPNANFIVCGRDNAGTIEAFTTRQYAAAFIGQSMSGTQQSDLYTIMQTYMTVVGANV